MSTRRPATPIHEEGRLITPEEKADREWRDKQSGLGEVVVMALAAVMVYPFVMIGRGIKKVWDLL